MRDRYAAAEAGGAEPFAMEQGIEQLALGQAGELRRALAQLAESFLLVSSALGKERSRRSSGGRQSPSIVSPTSEASQHNAQCTLHAAKPVDAPAPAIRPYR